MDDASETTDSRGIVRERVARALGVGSEVRDDVYKHVARAATLRDPTYWLELLMSAGIAILGLSLDSPAVIIGAMLISPLMGPILAAGLALAAGDFVLLTRTAGNIAISSLVAILFAAFFVALLPFREMTGEIAARVRPTTLDLVVALLSGAVGALAAGKSARGIATSIPGVAIAVALMPPLGVVGYGVGLALTVDPRQGAEVLRGGGLLFLTNLVAIVLSAMVVFVGLHFDDPELREKIRAWRESDAEGRFVHEFILRYPIPDWLDRVGTGPVRLTIPLIFVVFLFAPLSQSLEKIKSELAERKSAALVQQKATALWQDLFGKTLDERQRSSVLSFTSGGGTDRLELRLRVVTSEPLTAQERAMYTRLVGAALGHDPASIILDLVEIPTSEARIGRAPVPEKLATPGELIASLQARIGALLDGARFPSRARVISHGVTLGGDSPLVSFRYLAETELDADAEELIRANVRQALDVAGAEVTFEHLPAVLKLRFRNGKSEVDADTQTRLEAHARIALEVRNSQLSIRTPSESAIDQQRVSAVRSVLGGDGGLPNDRIATAVRDSLGRGEVEVAIVLP